MLKNRSRYMCMMMYFKGSYLTFDYYVFKRYNWSDKYHKATSG